MALGAAVVAPFVVLSFFNHPAADDFDYARQTLIRGFWGAQSARYRWWTGRYANSAIMSVNPLVVHWTGGFKVLPLLLLLLLAGSMYFFVRELTRPDWSTRHTLQAAIVLLVLYLQGMPSVSEGLYWYSSASTYQIPNAFSLILAGLVVGRYRDAKAIPGWRLTAGALLSIVVIIGSNETSLVILIVLLAALYASRVYLDGRLDRWAALLLAVATVSGVLVLSAPGNTARMALEAPRHRHSFLEAVLHSFDAVRQMPGWAASLPLILFALLLAPAASVIARRKGRAASVFQVNPALLISIVITAMVASYFPTYWSVEHGPLPRTLNVAYLTFLVGFFITVVSAVRHLTAGVANGPAGGEVVGPLPGYAVVFLAVAIVVSLKSEGGNVRRAWTDVVSGQAKRFDREVRERYKRLASCDAAVCDVEPIVSRPSTIRSDLDPWANQNEAIAYYFGKKAVRLRTAR
jgi:hypothetical protein